MNRRKMGWSYCCVALVALAGLTTPTANAQSDCLIISEIVDGPLYGGLPKWVELTNIGTESINLEEYSLGTISNGEPSSPSAPITMRGIVHPGVSYVCNFEFDDWPDNSSFYDVYSQNPDNYWFGAWINGNDVVVLYYGNPGENHDGTGAIDIYGVVGQDGVGTVWEYTDSYARRKNTVISNGAWDSNEWIFGGPGALEDEADLLANTFPGEHTYDSGCGPAGPYGRCCVDPYWCYITTEATCTGMGGVSWDEGLNCDGNPCGTPPPYGHCCMPEGYCLELTEAECTAEGGTDWEPNTYCNPDPCLDCTTIPVAKEGYYDPNQSVWDAMFCDVVVTNVIDVLYGDETASFHVQEESLQSHLMGGITVYGTTEDINAILNWAFEGDIIRIQGGLEDYAGLFELVSPLVFDPNYIQYGTGRPDPLVVTGADFDPSGPMAEKIESMYVVVECANFTQTGFFAGFTNYEVADQYGVFTVRVPHSGISIANEPIPEVPVSVGGIVSVYNDEIQLLITRAEDVVEDPNCLDYAACCLDEPNYPRCDVLTQAECSAQGGIWQNPGSLCLPFNPCLGAMGACCIEGACSMQTEADCLLLGGGYQGDYVMCDGFRCPLPVEAGDLAFGLSDDQADETTEQLRDDGMLRAGYKVGAWNNYSYVQSFEFDNYGGVMHAYNGNLLALNYGSPLTSGDPGGKLRSYCTDGSGRGQYALYEWNNATQGDADYLTRIVGLGVSPDNLFVSAWGWDKKRLFVLAYDEGPAPGTGEGAAITAAWKHIPAGPVTGNTQGTTWIPDPEPGTPGCFDEYTVLLGNHTGIPGQVALRTVHFDPPDPSGGFTETEQLLINFPAAGGFTDVEYNPRVSPYVFVMSSIYDGNSRSHLAVVDPHLDPAEAGYCDPWELVTIVDYSTSSQTSHEISLGPDGYLYWSQYSGLIDRVDITDVGALTDNSSEDWWDSALWATYSGNDIAFGSLGCRGDCNCDGQIDFGDINAFVAALGIPPVYCDDGYNADIDGNGSPGFEDINPFVALLTGYPLPIECPGPLDK